MHWMTKGKCQTAPTDWFFPPEGTTEISAEAVECCEGCPVWTDCAAYAANIGNAYGVWAGRLYEDGEVIDR